MKLTGPDANKSAHNGKKMSEKSKFTYLSILSELISGSVNFIYTPPGTPKCIHTHTHPSQKF
uniref:Uncharacterized protein n=1 Tax=Meloidogyne enterolobii TaxID=390850 RepID=A0A6V7XS97_MELEN|nr:unnamed protein product [Meloidogyne enterolobii]